MARLRRKQKEAELDITSFMNLMIILVPVLLMSMAFAHITVLDLRLPDAGPSTESDPKKKQPEVIIRADYIDINYPVGRLLKRVSKVEGDEEGDEEEYDFPTLSLTLRQLKRKLQEQGNDRRDIMVLAEPDTNYQAIVSVMDAVRSYEAVVVTDVVQAVLFPDIALGDAPRKGGGK